MTLPSRKVLSRSGASSTRAKSPFNMIALIISGVLICVISICCLGLIFFPPDPTTNGTSTALSTQIPIEQIIIFTAEAAKAQTLAVTSPLPTTTLIVIDVPTQNLNTPLPIFETSTPFIFAPIDPAVPADGSCACAGDTLNCKDFQTQTSAQACFNYCVSQGVGDVHKLDENNDGTACENN